MSGRGTLNFPEALPQSACLLYRMKGGAEGKGGFVFDERSYLQVSVICSVQGRVTHTRADRIRGEEGGSRTSHSQATASESRGRTEGTFTHGGKPRLRVTPSWECSA